MAMTAGFMLAEPIVLKIFEDSIEEQKYTELKQQKETAAMPYQTQVNALEDELKKDEARVNKLQTAYTEEADGTGGSGIRKQSLFTR